jgi:hypothetical protein
MNPIIYNSCVRYTIYEYSFIYTMYIYFFFCGNKCYNNCSSWRYIESNTGKSARQGNLRHPRVRFQSFADEATPEGVGDFPVLHFLPVFDFISHFLSAVFSFVFVCKQSYFPFMSIKKLVPYFCVLREGYYVIIWLIVRICVFIKDWKLIYSELFILKRKNMEIWGVGGTVDINCTACISW